MQSLLNVPAEVVSANINAAVAKAAAKKRRIFVLGIMAGAFIAMGAQSSSLAVHNITDVGIARTLVGTAASCRDTDPCSSRSVVIKFQAYSTMSSRSLLCTCFCG